MCLMYDPTLRLQGHQPIICRYTQVNFVSLNICAIIAETAWPFPLTDENIDLMDHQ